MTCLYERNRIGRDVVYQQISLVYYIYRCIDIFFNQTLNKTQDTSRFTEDTHTHTHTYTYMYLLILNIYILVYTCVCIYIHHIYTYSVSGSIKKNYVASRYQNINDINDSFRGDAVHIIMHQPPPKALPLFIFPSSLGLLGSRPPCIAPAGGATGALPPLLLSFRAKMSSKGPNRRSKASLSKASVVQLRLQKNLGKLGKKYAIRKGCLLTDCLRAGIQRYPALQHRHLHCIAYCQ